MHVVSGSPSGSGLSGTIDDRRTAYRAVTRGHQRDPPAPEQRQGVDRNAPGALPDSHAQPRGGPGRPQHLTGSNPDRGRCGRRFPRIKERGRARNDRRDSRVERCHAPDRDPQAARPGVADHDIDDSGHPPRKEHTTRCRRTNDPTRNGAEHHATSTRAVPAVGGAKAPDNRSVDRCHERRRAPGRPATRHRIRCEQRHRDRNENRDCGRHGGHGTWCVPARDDAEIESEPS